ncbi:MAG: biotin/lipoyl-containing protein [Planctomycetota bacterium]|nr:biotin/lipoyl-containing protein [Planctomycetota bacterium]
MSQRPEGYQVRIPDFEMPGANLILTGWLTSSGTVVESGEPLCEICAGDIVVEITARRDGIFHHAAIEVDDRLSTGMVIGTIDVPLELDY